MTVAEQLVTAKRANQPLWRLGAESPTNADYPAVVAPPPVADAAVKAMSTGQTHYVDVHGIRDLRVALGRFAASLGLPNYADTETAVAAGEQEARFLAIQALTRDGATLALPAVAHPGASSAAAVRRTRVITIAVADDHQPTLVGLRAALADGARVIYLEHPNRLTGAALPAAVTAELPTLLNEFDARAIIDIGLAPFGGAAARAGIAALAAARDRIVYLGTPWPGFGAEQWSVGFHLGPADLLTQIRTLKQIVAICTCAPAQWGLLAAEPEYEERFEGALLRQRGRRREASAALAGRALDGDAATVVAFRASGDVIEKLAAAGVTVTDGATFGAPGVVRLTLGEAPLPSAALAILTEAK